MDLRCEQFRREQRPGQPARCKGEGTEQPGESRQVREMGAGQRADLCARRRDVDHRPEHRHAIGRDTAYSRAASERALPQVRGAPGQHTLGARDIEGVAGRLQCRIRAVEVVGGAAHRDAFVLGQYVAVATDHDARGRERGRRQVALLTAHVPERIDAEVDAAGCSTRIGEHDDGRLRDDRIARAVRAPALADARQRADFGVGVQGHARSRRSELARHDRCRRCPTPVPKPPAALRDRSTRKSAGGVTGHVLRIVRRIGQQRGGVGDAGLVVGAVGKLQYAATPPRLSGRTLRLRIQKACAGPARKQTVVARNVRLEYSRAQTRRRCGGRVRALDEIDAPAARHEPRGDRCTCQAGPDDDGALVRRARPRDVFWVHRPARREVARQHLALAAEPETLVDTLCWCATT